MKRLFPGLLCFASWLTVSGCSEDPGSTPQGGDVTGIAVVCSDYMSASISLLDTAGTLTTNACINSGSQAPALSLALSGDLALPSAPQWTNELVIIDRANSALTFIDPSGCTPRAQLSLSTGFSSNPHDVVSVSETKIYVTRAGHNGSPTASEVDYDEGDDVLIVDPTVPEITGRIDLTSYTPQVDGTRILPRADRALLIEGLVYVTMNAQDESYMVTAPARLVWIDPRTDSVAGTLDLPDYANCGAMTYLDENKTLLVACSGAFVDGSAQAERSGVVAVDVSANPPVVSHGTNASAFDGRPVSGFAIAAMSATQIFVVTMGSFDGPADALWRLSLEDDTTTRLAQGSNVFQFSGLVSSRENQRVLLTDGSATSPLIHVFDASEPTQMAEVLTFDPSPTLGLPPRAVATY